MKIGLMRELQEVRTTDGDNPGKVLSPVVVNTAEILYIRNGPEEDEATITFSSGHDLTVQGDCASLFPNHLDTEADDG